MADTPFMATVVHHVPGRLRLRVRGARAGTAFLDQVAHLLGRVDGVRAVRVNPASSSLVVHYQASDHELALRIRQHPALSWWPLSAAGVTAAPPFRLPAMGARPGRSHVAGAIVSTSLRLDSSMRRASAGYVDLKLLLPVLFATASSYMMRSGQGTPMWMTLAVSAFNSFVSLHPAGAPVPAGQLR